MSLENVESKALSLEYSVYRLEIFCLYMIFILLLI